MNVRVRLFAVARQLAGRDLVEVDVDEPATVSKLRTRLAAEIPALGEVLPHVTFAIGTRYVGDSAAIANGDDLACIPPVSGG